MMRHINAKAVTISWVAERDIELVGSVLALRSHTLFRFVFNFDPLVKCYDTLRV